MKQEKPEAKPNDAAKFGKPTWSDTECCEDCFVPSHDVQRGHVLVAVDEGCGDKSCICHWTPQDWKEAKGEAKYEASREDW